MLCLFLAYSKVIHVCVHVYMYVCIYVYVYILFQSLFHYILLQDIKYSSLCYTVGPCCLSTWVSFFFFNLS